MALRYHWPLQTGRELVDLVSGANLTNDGGVQFSKNGAIFDGTNRLYTSATYSIGEVKTTSLWIQPATFSYSPMYIFSTYVSTADRQYTIFGYPGYPMYYKYGEGGGAVSSEFTSIKYPTSAPTLIVFTHNNTTAKAWRNNTQVLNLSSTPTAIDTPLSIGSQGAETGTRWHGIITDLRMSDAEISTEQIAALYAAGPNPTINTQYSYAI